MASNSPYDQQSADCIYLQSTPSPQAVAPAEMEDDLARDYLVKVQADTEFSKSLQNQLLHSPKSLCPGDSVKSACFKKVLNSIQITSTPQVVLLSLIATSASFDDQKNHVPDADLRLLDNLLLILERTSLTQFHLSRMQAVTPVQRISLKMLKSDDEKLIAQQVVTKMLPMIDKKMSEFQKTRAPASVASYRVEKLSELKRRLETLRRRTWSYHF